MAAWIRFAGLVGLILSVTACAAPEGPASTAARTLDPNRQSFAPGEYILTVKSGVGVEAINGLYAAFGVERVQALSGGRFLLKLMRDPGIERIQSIGAESQKIDAVQRNIIYRTQ